MEIHMATRKNRRTVTAEDLYQFNTVPEVRISPDGLNVLYTVQRVERKTEKKYTNLWVAPMGNGEPKQFTTGAQHDANGRWSPDGQQIAFLSDRGNKDKPEQIYLIRFTGGEASRLTQIDGEIRGMTWCSGGR